MKLAESTLIIFEPGDPFFELVRRLPCYNEMDRHEILDHYNNFEWNRSNRVDVCPTLTTDEFPYTGNTPYVVFYYSSIQHMQALAIRIIHNIDVEAVLFTSLILTVHSIGQTCTPVFCEEVLFTVRATMDQLKMSGVPYYD